MESVINKSKKPKPRVVFQSYDSAWGSRHWQNRAHKLQERRWHKLYSKSLEEDDAFLYE